MKNINNILNFVLTPGYISGLTQSDGSFFCTISLSPKHLFGLQFRPKFSITADLDSKHVLDRIQTYFGCGNVVINESKHTAEFVVSSLKDLKGIIIPHFHNYPVYCSKLHAFKLFDLIVSSLVNKEKKTIEGRRELLGMALSMNQSTNRKEDRISILCKCLSMDVKDLVLIPNNCLGMQIPLSSSFISGVIDGDGSFFVYFLSTGEIKLGFTIVTDLATKVMLQGIQTYLKGIGSIRVGTKNELVYTVLGINQIVDVLIPFMDANPILSERALHYDKFQKVSLLLKENNPLPLSVKLEIVDLCYDMNKEGKRRALSKLQYIELLKQINNQ
nr:hypothetical protein [Rhizoctonia sp.]